MNTFGYFFHQLAARLGLVSSRSYLRNATEEAILLAEAEVLLGKLVWEDLESVDAISVEYWNLRDLQREQESLREKLNVAKEEQEKTLAGSLEPPPEVSSKTVDLEERVNANRREYLDNMAAVQKLITNSNALYKRFNGQKLKLNVLKNEGADEESLGSIRTHLREIRDEYSRLARVIANDKERVRQLEKRGEALQQEAANARKVIADFHRGHTRCIAENGKAIVELSARIEHLEKKKRDLQKDIGKFLCRNSHSNPELSAVAKKVAPLLDRTRGLMDSIRLNYRLAEFR